jgi:hypothetical protein
MISLDHSLVHVLSKKEKISKKKEKEIGSKMVQKSKC